MAYTKVNWQDLPSTQTPLNATNLNHMDDGIAAALTADNIKNTQTTSTTDTYSCTQINNKINTAGNSVTFNNEWRVGYKPPAGNFMTTVPIHNPNKKTVSYSNGFTVDIYMGGWQACTYSTSHILETELGIRIILPSGVTLTDGDVYLIRMNGTITVNN